MAQGAENVIFQSLGGPVEKYLNLGGPSSGLKKDLVSGNSKFIFLADEFEAAKLRWAGGAQRPVWHGSELKKTGARSARARTRAHARPKPTSLSYIHLGSSVCHIPVCHPVIIAERSAILYV